MSTTNDATSLRATDPPSSQRDPRVDGPLLARWLLLAGAICFAIALVRYEPSLIGDRGVFVSGGAAIWDGAALYTDFYDHKDPGFYYSIALATGLFGASGLFVMDLLLLVAAGLTGTLLGRRAGAGVAAAILTGAATTAALSHPDFYLTGMSQLPGLVIWLLAALLAVDGRNRLAGVALAAVVLLKMPLVMLAIALGVWIWVRNGRRAALAAGWAFASTIALGIFLLLLRGELAGFVDATRLNLGYADTLLSTRGNRPTPFGTLATFVDVVRASTYWPQVAGLVFLGATVATRIVILRRKHDHSSDPFALLFLLSVAASLVVAATTTLFAHHLQVLAIPSALALLAVVEATQKWTRRPLAIVAITGAALISLDGLPAHLRSPSPDFSLRSELALFVEATLEGRVETGQPVPYAVVGENTEEALVAFLPSEFERTCRFGYQLPWFGQERLEEHLECVTSGPDVVVQSNVNTLTQSYLYEATYAAFIADVETVLNREFTLVGETRLHGWSSRVWIRKGLGSQ